MDNNRYLLGKYIMYLMFFIAGIACDRSWWTVMVINLISGLIILLTNEKKVD